MLFVVDWKKGNKIYENQEEICKMIYDEELKDVVTHFNEYNYELPGAMTISKEILSFLFIN